MVWFSWEEVFLFLVCVCVCILFYFLVGFFFLLFFCLANSQPWETASTSLGQTFPNVTYLSGSNIEMYALYSCYYTITHLHSHYHILHRSYPNSSFFKFSTLTKKTKAILFYSSNIFTPSPIITSFPLVLEEELVFLFPKLTLPPMSLISPHTSLTFSWESSFFSFIFLFPF